MSGSIYSLATCGGKAKVGDRHCIPTFRYFLNSEHVRLWSVQVMNIKSTFIFSEYKIICIVILQNLDRLEKYK